MRADLDEFLNDYDRMYRARYADAADHVERTLVTTLKQEGIRLRGQPVRVLSASRAKDTSSLKDKIYDKYKDTPPVVSGSDIVRGTKDLGGVRIALYYPTDWMVVESVIFRHFGNVTVTTHPAPAPRPPRRFEGYGARHYGIDAGTIEVADDAAAVQQPLRIEVQVSSLLMHGWAEVDHDLTYKPGGVRGGRSELSFDEVASLDSLNGLVIAGEVALNSLHQRLVTKGTIKKWPLRKFGDAFTRAARDQLVIIGQNLTSLLRDDSFVNALTGSVSGSPALSAHLVVADPSDAAQMEDFSWGAADFLPDLEESIGRLRNLAASTGRLKASLSPLVRRETLFIRDPDDDDAQIVMKYTPPGTRPEDRMEITIDKKRHPDRFDELWLNRYKALVDSARPLS
jgi:ppGpp synthetase/RelA/SpoT-type nucleotidyltranferase